MISMYRVGNSTVPQYGLQKDSRQVVRIRPSTIARPLFTRKGVYQPNAMAGGGGGGCYSGPPRKKPTDDEDPGRSTARQEVLLAGLTLKELMGVLGFLLGSALVGLGVMSIGQGPGWRAAPLNDILKSAVITADRAVSTADRAVTRAERAVSTADRAVDTADRAVDTADRAVNMADRAVSTADHITAHRTETRFFLSYLMGAFVAAAAIVRKKDGDDTPSNRMLAGMGAASAVMLYSAIKSKEV